MPIKDKNNDKDPAKERANARRGGAPVPGGPKDPNPGPTVEVLRRLDAMLDRLIEKRLASEDRAVSEAMRGEMFMSPRSKKKMLFTLRPD